LQGCFSALSRKFIAVIPVIPYITDSFFGAKMKPVSFKIDEELIGEIDALAQETHESRSSLIKKAISFYLDNYDGVIAKARQDDPDSVMIAHEDVLKEYGLL